MLDMIVVHRQNALHIWHLVNVHLSATFIVNLHNFMVINPIANYTELGFFLPSQELGRLPKEHILGQYHHQTLNLVQGDIKLEVFGHNNDLILWILIHKLLHLSHTICTDFCHLFSNLPHIRHRLGKFFHQIYHLLLMTFVQLFCLPSNTYRHFLPSVFLYVALEIFLPDLNTFKFSNLNLWLLFFDWSVSLNLWKTLLLLFWRFVQWLQSFLRWTIWSSLSLHSHIFFNQSNLGILIDGLDFLQ